MQKEYLEDENGALWAECLRCRYMWCIRVAHPKLCPACKSRSWDKPRETAPQEAHDAPR